MNIFLVLNITRPDPEAGVGSLGDSGDTIQDTFTGIFAAFDQIYCIFMGLFTGVWC